MNPRAVILLTQLSLLTATLGCGDVGYRRSQALRDLKSSNTDLRDRALESILCDPHNRKEFIPGMINCLKDDKQTIRRKAIIALGQLGSDALRNLVKAFNNDEPIVRAGAIQAFQDPPYPFKRKFSKKEDKKIFPLLIKSCRDRNYSVRISAAKSLRVACHCVEMTDMAVRELLKLMVDQKREVNVAATIAVGMFGADLEDELLIKKVIEQLKKNLQPKDNWLRNVTIRSFGKFGKKSKEALPEIIDTLRVKDDEVRTTVYFALGRELRSLRDLTVPLLLNLLRDNNKDTRYWATLCLRNVGPLDNKTIPPLIVALKDDDLRVREFAAIIIGDMGPRAKKSVKDLKIVIPRNPVEVRLKIARALWKINGDAKTAIPLLLEGADHNDPKVRRYAVYNLGMIGQAAVTALPKLQKLVAMEKNEYVRDTAIAAIEKIESK